VTGGQVEYGSPASALAELDRSRVYPLAGPVFVSGASPGDILEIEMLELAPGGWGWSGIIPGRGLLSDRFADPYIRYFDLGAARSAEFRPGIRIPIAPFPGTIGVAPDVPGRLPVRPPNQGGGNIDTRSLTKGAKLYLPVLVPGALLSIGDCHAAQGDGEVCVTGIECDMAVSVRVVVLRGTSLPPSTYQLTTPQGSRPPGPRFAASASGPDLFEDSRNAVLGVIDWLARERDLSLEDAYVLCSLAADLEISQIVNAPNFCVTASLPLSIFGAEAGADE
jgi:acetamidase/formamidase